MSVSGISGSSFFAYSTQSVQNKMQQFRQEFQQLGQDLQSGNLSAAQSDFVTLQQYGPQGNSTASAPATSTASSQGGNPIAQEFNQLAQDLQSGNLSAAQQDYSTLQQDFQNLSAQNQGMQGHYHHHHHHGGGGGGSSEVSQLFSQLGQALQSGNLSAAQQAYTTLQQDFQQFAQNDGLPTPASSQSSSNGSSSGISVTA